MATKKAAWKTLQHHEGSAVNVPKWAESLAGGDYSRASSEFELAYVDPGKTCSAAAPTVSFLLDLLPEAKRPEWVLRTVGNIAGNDLLWSWLRAPDEISGDVGLALYAQRSKIFDALKHENLTVRSAAAFALGAAPSSLLDEASKRLDERISVDASEHVIASAALALARLHVPSGTFTRLAKHASALVRGAAALARLRADPSLDIESALKDGLIDWLGANTKPRATNDAFWWWGHSPRFASLHGSFHTTLQNGVMLGDLATHTRQLEHLTELLLDLPNRTDNSWACRGATDCLGFAHGLKELPSEALRKPADLTASQRAFAQQAADSRLFAIAGNGLPACGAVRRRWLGLDPASVLETPVEAEGGKEPLYWIWHQLVLDGSPVAQIQALTGAARWEVEVSQATGEYWWQWLAPDEGTINAVIAAAAADSAIAKVGPARANEVARRLVECRRQELDVKFTSETCSLILIPLCRSGVAWDAEWAPLLILESEVPGLNRELVQWMPAEAREAWIWENQQRQRYEVHFVDLLPSARLVARALLTIQEVRDDNEELPDTSVELERKVHELAATVPHFAQGVREAVAGGYERQL